MAKKSTTKTAPKVDPKVTKKSDRSFSLKNAPFEAAMPDGFSFDDHKAIKREHFAHEKWYFEHRALFFEHRAAKCRVDAEMAAKYGSREERVKAQRVVRLQKKVDELRVSLEAEGVDVDALLAAATESE